ncbi:MAG: YigZ family protein [Clostridiales bacterium]|nr:YigZ family protein [Clostridiales bacterium]
MQDEFVTILENSTGEIVVKKSRFIASLFPVETEDAANEIIEGIRKKYWDATHNCYAYIVGTGNPIMRFSDDGEPSRTAGKPMLDILLAHRLTNVLAVVTRYFGGTLLGTGGLVKAYQGAVLEGLKNSKVITKQLGFKTSVITDYNLVGKLQHFAATENIAVLSCDYTDIVNMTLLVPVTRADMVTKKITELTNGSASINITEQVYFTIIDGEALLL